MAAGRQARPTSRAPGTDPDFVSSIRIDGRSVSGRLRLPTFFCAPNVAWLMVTDARRAVAAVHGVDHVDVALDGHVTAKEINVGVATDADFDGAFPGLADGGLDDLRATSAAMRSWRASTGCWPHCAPTRGRRRPHQDRRGQHRG